VRGVVQHLVDQKAHVAQGGFVVQHGNNRHWGDALQRSFPVPFGCRRQAADEWEVSSYFNLTPQIDEVPVSGG
jgi:hypothetical protein